MEAESTGSVPGRYSRFIDELRKYSKQPVPVLQGSLRDAVRLDGFAILDAFGDPALTALDLIHEQRAELAARLVPIGLDVAAFESRPETVSLAAAIDGSAFERWQHTTPTDAGAWGLYGLRDVGRRVGGNCFKPHSGSYCELFGFEHSGLPHLLADYLRELSRTA